MCAITVGQGLWRAYNFILRALCGTWEHRQSIQLPLWASAVYCVQARLNTQFHSLFWVKTTNLETTDCLMGSKLNDTGCRESLWAGAGHNGPLRSIGVFFQISKNASLNFTTFFKLHAFNMHCHILTVTAFNVALSPNLIQKRYIGRRHFDLILKTPFRFGDIFTTFYKYVWIILSKIVSS